MSGAFINGFFASACLIVSIGAQNAHVLAAGIRRQHHAAVALLCAACDATLITIGTSGVGSALARSPTLLAWATWGGVAFLLAYGVRSFYSALKPSGLQRMNAPVSVRAAVLTTLAVSVLNPHAYLDTVVLLGSMSAGFEGAARGSFTLGAILASFSWFFALAFGAKGLAPILETARSWQVIDVLMGISMWGLAALLVL